MARIVLAVSLVWMFVGRVAAQPSRIELTCPGPTEDRGHELVARDPYGITDTVRPGESRAFCRDITGVVPITGVSCRLKPYLEASGWLCTTGQPCAGVTFGRVVFDTTGSGANGAMHECVTVQNTSRYPRDIQIHTRQK